MPATFVKDHANREHPVLMSYRRPHLALSARDELVGVFWSPPFEGPLLAPAADVPRYYEAYPNPNPNHSLNPNPSPNPHQAVPFFNWVAWPPFFDHPFYSILPIIALPAFIFYDALAGFNRLGLGLGDPNPNPKPDPNPNPDPDPHPNPNPNPDPDPNPNSPSSYAMGPRKTRETFPQLSDVTLHPRPSAPALRPPPHPPPSALHSPRSTLHPPPSP